MQRDADLFGAPGERDIRDLDDARAEGDPPTGGRSQSGSSEELERRLELLERDRVAWALPTPSPSGTQGAPDEARSEGSDP